MTMNEPNRIAAFEMHLALINNGTCISFLGQEWLITHTSIPEKIEHFHPMDPTESSINAPAVDGYAWAVTTDNDWVLLKAIGCIKAKTSFMSSN